MLRNEKNDVPNHSALEVNRYDINEIADEPGDPTWVIRIVRVVFELIGPIVIDTE